MRVKTTARLETDRTKLAALQALGEPPGRYFSLLRWMVAVRVDTGAIRPSAADNIRKGALMVEVGSLQQKMCGCSDSARPAPFQSHQATN
jgi:hypothetical protein